MKRLLFFLFFVVFCVQASNDSELFEKANKAYEARDYKLSLSLYKSIEKKDPSVWYNIGNTFYHLGEHVEAAIAWERARTISFYRDCDDCNDNISMIGKKIHWPNEVHQPPRSFNRTKRFFAGHSFLLHQVLFLFVWYLLFLLIFGNRFFSFKVKRYAVFSVACFVVFFGAGATLKHQSHTSYFAFVICKDVHLFAGPNNDYHIVGQINCAEKINVICEVNDWYKVKHKGKVGWMMSDSVELV